MCCCDVGTTYTICTAVKSAGISADDWNELKDEVLKVAICNASVKAFPVKGYDAALWKELTDDQREKIHRLDKTLHPPREEYKSTILKFFLETEDIDYDHYDSSVSAMALICALLLTIPFGVLSLMNGEYFTSQKTYRVQPLILSNTF